MEWDWCTNKGCRRLSCLFQWGFAARHWAIHPLLDFRSLSAQLKCCVLKLNRCGQKSYGSWRGCASPCSIGTVKGFLQELGCSIALEGENVCAQPQCWIPSSEQALQLSLFFCMPVCRARAIINAELLSWVLAKPTLIFQSQLRRTESAVSGRAVGQTFLRLIPASLIVKHHLMLSVSIEVRASI